MAIRNRKTETKTPENNLVLFLTTKSGIKVRLGTMGLFENNNYHTAVADMTDDELAQLNLSFTVEAYGTERSQSISKDDLI